MVPSLTKQKLICLLWPSALILTGARVYNVQVVPIWLSDQSVILAIQISFLLKFSVTNVFGGYRLACFIITASLGS